MYAICLYTDSLCVYFIIYLSCLYKYITLIYVIDIYYYYKYPSLIVKFGLQTEGGYKNVYKFLSFLYAPPV